MANVPSNLIPSRISQLPEAPVADPAGYFPIVISGTTYKVQFSQINQNLTVPPSRAINAGTGLTGGGTLSHDITIAVANGGIGDTQLNTTGVSAGTYGDGSNVPVVTVNTKGRVTSLSTTPLVISGYVPTSRQIVAGTGLTGGGNLTADRTLVIDFSSATPQPLGSATAGTGTNAAREDHVHPAVDLSDGTETSGVLPMGRGGSGANLSPVAGAIVITNGSNFALTSVGSTGQILLAAGASTPVWGDVASLTVDAADRLLGGAANQVVYQAGTSDTSFVIAPTVSDTFLKWNGSSFEWGAIAGAGTVTSVQGSGGTTGLTVSGGPITTAGTLTLGGTLTIGAGGTGLGDAPTNGQLLIGNGSGYTLAGLTAGTAISVTDATGSITIANTAPDQTVVITGAGLISVAGAYPSFNISATEGFSGTVTSIDLSSTVSGLNFSGGPVTDSGVITMAGTLGISSGGTGLGSTPTNGQLLIGNGTGFSLSTLTAGTAINVADAAGSISISNTAPDQTVTLTDGTAISVTGTYPSFTITNTLPDQTVVITGGGLITVGGSYPSFNISATEGFSGTVTSIDVSSTVSGLTFSGGPVTDSGVITMAGTLGISSGGTALSSTPTNGQLLIGNGAGYALSTLTAGSNFSVTNSTGSITLAVLSDVSLNSATITTLTSTSAGITTLTSGSATLTNLTSTSGTVSTLFSTSASVTNLAVTSLTVSSLSLSNATFTSATITTLKSTSATIDNLASTSADITTLTGTTFGTTATTQIRGASGQISQFNSTSATISTLTGTSMSVTNLSLGSLVISSTTLVANLNADLLDGQTGSYYQNLANATGNLSGGTY